MPSDHDFDDEIQNHIDLLTERLIAQGTPPEEARYAARRQFGNTVTLKETRTEMRPFIFLETLWQDLRYGARSLRKNTAFTAVAVLTLALGVGANTALFTIVNSVLLRPLPFPHSERLFSVSFNPRIPSMPFIEGTMYDGDYAEYDGENRSFGTIATYGERGFNMTGAGAASHLHGLQVTSRFFSTLGVSPSLGRIFLPEERDGVVILSDSLWRSRFASSPAVLGRVVQLDDRSYTIVGVMPSGFAFPKPVDLWSPLTIDIPKGARRGNAFFRPVIGRLRDGYDAVQARAEFDTVTRNLIKENPNEHREDPTRHGRWMARIVPLRDFTVRNVRLSLMVLLGAVGFLLLIACANVAALLLARVSQRRREVALRASLGASRGRLVRQFLTESMLIAFCGGLVGAMLAAYGVKIILSILPEGRVPRSGEIGIDLRVLGFTLVTSLMVGVAVGILPALQAWRPNLNTPLKELSQSAGNRFPGHERRLRGLLVIAEVAVTLVLMIGAGLMGQSFLRLRSARTGFDGASVLTASVQLSPAAYRTTGRMMGFYRDAIKQLSSIPGVAAAGAVNWLPLGGDLISGNFYVEGRLIAPDFDVDKPAVGGDYFRAMGIALRAGRFFTGRDDATAPGAVIISESVSRRLWPEGNPLGKRISLEDNRKPEDWLTIVGVVEDVKQNNMAEKSPPAIYQPYQQVIRTSFLGNVTFVLRSDQDLASLTDAVRTRIQRIDPGQPVLRIATMQDLIASSTAEPRFQAQLIGAFSVLALILASIGIFGVISYSISERTKEIGIRMAIGARAPDLLAMVIRQGMLLVSIGILLGCAGAWGITRVLAKFLFELTPTDPPTFVGAPAIFAFIALVAILIPGRRALRVDPVAAIRNE